jgi:transmembrane 9 superfamily protein 2/4
MTGINSQTDGSAHPPRLHHHHHRPVFSTMRSASSLFLIASLVANGVSAFYLPGMAPTNYRANEDVPVFVNTIVPALSQTDQQLRSVISYDCIPPQTLPDIDYDPRFHFCQPQDGPVKQSESLGSILFGDRIFSSPLSLKMIQNSTCNVLCRARVPAPIDVALTSDTQFINEKIVDSYSMNWLIDGLPAARIRIDPQSGEKFYSIGFELGSVDNAGTPLLNTHYDIVVEYHVCRSGRRSFRPFRVISIVWSGLLCSLRVAMSRPMQRETSTVRPNNPSLSTKTLPLKSYTLIVWNGE